MVIKETAVTFNCMGSTLLGVTHQGNDNALRGVLIVVGGPQYRVGSHRQFLQLARGLAADGIPVFRFDYRGMGDSEGQLQSYEMIDEDIRSAVDTFFKESKGLQEVILWGLCDGASAASFYAFQDQRVKGLILVNPWIRTERGEAKAYLKHYYLRRFWSKNFWNKVLTGKFKLGSSLQSLLRMFKKISIKTNQVETENQLSVPERFYQGIKKFRGPCLLVTSGKDLTAAEFLDTVSNDNKWKKLLARAEFSHKTLPDADHTFSRKEWMDEVIKTSSSWSLKN